MAQKLFDDFSGEEIQPGTGWALTNVRGEIFHFQNLSGLLAILATKATVFGADADRDLAHVARLRVSRMPAKAASNGRAQAKPRKAVRARA